MKKALYLSIFSLFLLSASHVQAEPKTIILSDGSQVKGELVGIENGAYIVNTSFGQVEIDEGKVLSINSSQAIAAPVNAMGQMQGIGQMMPGMGGQSSSPMQGQIQAMQSQIMSDPNLMADIQAMAKDPELMKLMTDPSLMNAATTGNLQDVEGNPNTQTLMNHPKMQALMQKLQGGQQ